MRRNPVAALIAAAVLFFLGVLVFGLGDSTGNIVWCMYHGDNITENMTLGTVASGCSEV